MTIPILDTKQVLDHLALQKNPFFEDYYAFYSSWYGGIIKDPHFMLVPIDDHMVHRGDGVFEAMKAIGRSVYMLDEHLERLFRSAAMIELTPALSHDELKHIILDTLCVANKPDATVRVYMSRGPGNFSVNPYDAIQSQCYVVITRLYSPAKIKYLQGVSIGKSQVRMKDSWMAQVKSCNYLPNVLMKKEAVDRHLDFVISVDNRGYIAEGATENILLVDAQGVIVHPELDTILKGTTMTRIGQLAHKNGIATEMRPVSVEELKSAREVMMTGTTIDVLPVIAYEQSRIHDGKPGPITQAVYALLMEDMLSGPLRTRY